jgi:hypothetical protein
MIGHRPRKARIIPALVILSASFTLLLMAITWQALAQDGTDPSLTPTAEFDDWYTTPQAEWNLPYFQPGTSEGDAEWSVSVLSFESRFPNGFIFEALPASDQGEVVEASIIWSHTPNDLRRRSARIDPGTGVARYAWSPDEDLPPWVAVNYYWSFTDSAGNRFRTDWVVGDEYRDPRHSWTRLESDMVIVFVEEGLPAELGMEVASAMNEQREMFNRAWGGHLPYKPRVILFADSRNFRIWQRDIFTNSVLGRTDPQWGATVQILTDNGLQTLVEGIVPHEIAHLYQFEFAPDVFNESFWLAEGNATLFELEPLYNYEDRVRRLAENDQLPRLLEGTGPEVFGADGANRLGYDVGYTFWRWVIDNFGMKAHREIVAGFAATGDRNLVLEQVLGLPLLEIENRWREWIGAPGPAPTLIPTWTLPPFPPTVTPFQFNN